MLKNISTSITLLAAAINEGMFTQHSPNTNILLS